MSLPQVGYAIRPIQGETASGDACAVWTKADRIVLAVADGLGHGPHAAHAAQTALRCIGARLDDSCEGIFAACETQLRDTRGVALALAIVEPAKTRVTVAVVGNNRAIFLTGQQEVRLPAACGIVGASYRELTPQCLLLAAGDVLALYSDGFAELLPLRELLQSTPAPAQQLAETALDRWATGRDDAAMLIYRHAG